MNTSSPHTSAAAVEISIVIPLYKCAACLSALHARLTHSLERLGVRYELIFVDDCSPDNCWELLQELAAGDPHLKAYRLSRNFGQHAAITAGLSHCRGEYAIVMDGDLEDPPEEIPRLYRTALAGYDVVFARRQTRWHSVLRRAASRVYFALLSWFSQARITGEHGTLSMISRKVIDAYLRVGDVDRHYLLILNWLGFRSTEVVYDRLPRHAGKSSYSLPALLDHALNGLFFQTTVLLRWIVYVGFGVSACGGALTLLYLYRYASGNVPSGWTTLAVLQLLLSGFIIISTGVAALYIGKVFQQVKGRPLFVVAECIDPQAFHARPVPLECERQQVNGYDLAETLPAVRE